MSDGAGRSRVRASGAGRAVRAMSRRRAERLGASEVSYRLYLSVMLAIIVAAPAVRVIVLRLVESLPQAGSGSAEVVAAAATAATAALVLAGSAGGPALATLPQLDLLFASGLSRARLFAPRVLRAACWGGILGAAITALVVVARALRGEATGEWAAATLVAAAGVGVLGAMAVLVGQLGRRTRALVSGALAVLAAAQLGSDLEPGSFGLGGLRSAPRDPWSIWAGLVAGGSGQAGAAANAATAVTIVPTALALSVGLLVALCGPWIASRMRWEALRDQAARWDVVRVLAVTGDPSAALVRLGAPVRMGRRIRFRPGRGSGLCAILARRDLLGVVRAPGRSLAGLLAAVGAGALWVQALAPAPDGAADAVRAALVGAAAFVACALGAQPWSRGLATAAAGSGSPPLLPASPGGLLAAHLIVPGALCAIAPLAGAAVALGGAAWTGQDAGDGARIPWTLASAVLLGAIAMLLRVVGALKGPIPMRLLAPIPTPVGDASGINVLLWTLDGPLCALLLGAILGALWASAVAGSPVLAVAVSVALAAGLVAWARSRLGSQSV